jgi:hypothetical protein
MKDGFTRFEITRGIALRYHYLNMRSTQILAMVDTAHNKGKYEGKNFTIVRKGNTELFYIY